MDGDEKFYGLGDKTGFLNKRDYEYENWNSDIPQAHTDSYRALYKSIPFLITLKKESVYGIFFDNTYRSYVNLGKENQAYFYNVWHRIPCDKIVIFIARYDAEHCGRLYLSDRERTPLPQRGHSVIISPAGEYDSADCIKKVAREIQRTISHVIRCILIMTIWMATVSLHGMRKITAIRQRPFRSWQTMDSRQSHYRSGCEIRSGL